jgi:hypothetical protein
MTRPKPTAKRFATLEDLKAKPRRTKEVDIPIGESVLSIVVGSINTKAYDDLVSEHPPSKKDKDSGAMWNVETFAPAVMAACTINPPMTEEQALELWNSDDWSRGELFDWFMACIDVCNSGMRVPTSASDSD